MVQDALLAAYRWLVGGADLALRLLPLLVLASLALLALRVLGRRFDPEGVRRLEERASGAWPKVIGPTLAIVAAVLLGGGLVQARKLVVARRMVVEQSSASRRNEPSLSGVVQYAPAVAVLEEKTYRRTLTLPPDFLTRIGAEGVQVLSPYLSDPSSDEVLRLKDEFKRSGTDVIFTREVVRRDESPVAAESAKVSLGFTGKGAAGRRRYEAAFDGVYRFRNPRSAEATMRFNFPLPQGGGTLQEFAIEAAGARITDPDDKGLYVWSATVPAGGEVEAHVRYRITGAGQYDYVLGSERRRIGDFRLVATSEQSPKFGRSGIYPTRVSGREAEWALHDVLTAQSVSLVFPRADVEAESFEKTLWWLPAVLAIFALGAAWLAPRGAIGATVAFGFGLYGIPVVSAYAGPAAATLIGAGLAAALGGAALPRARLLAPGVALLACVFLTIEHGGAAAWILALVAAVFMLARKGRGLLTG